jgi:collagenase-like PrtC family protease
MNTLESRKQLLLLESELNRAQLVRDVVELKVGAGKLNGRTRSFASIVSSTAVLVSALTAFRHGKPNAAGVKSPWLQTLLKSAGFLSTLWLASGSERCD